MAELRPFIFRFYLKSSEMPLYANWVLLLYYPGLIPISLMLSMSCSLISFYTDLMLYVLFRLRLKSWEAAKFRFIRSYVVF